MRGSDLIGHGVIVKPLATALLLLAVLAGCSSPSADRPTKAVDELAAHDGRPCPEKLPQATKQRSATDEPATSTPTLPTADAGWVCVYTPRGGWTLTDRARRLDAAETDGIARLVADLTPEEKDQVCSSDLGRRVMVVLSARGDLTGLVIDDFGCRTVRMTDEPFTTVPGDATQGGAVSGTLTPSATLRSALLGAAGTG